VHTHLFFFLIDTYHKEDYSGPVSTSCYTLNIVISVLENWSRISLFSFFSTLD